jgi:hypothetical protein
MTSMGAALLLAYRRSREPPLAGTCPCWGIHARFRSADAAAATLRHAGGVPEWPKGTGCKPVGTAFGGSNPPSPMDVSMSVQAAGRLCLRACRKARQPPRALPAQGGPRTRRSAVTSASLSRRRSRRTRRRRSRRASSRPGSARRRHPRRPADCRCSQGQSDGSTHQVPSFAGWSKDRLVGWTCHDPNAGEHHMTPVVDDGGRLVRNS